MFSTLWRWIKRLVFILWCVALVLVGMWMLHENPTQVTVNYLDVVQREQPLGLLIFQMLFIGFVLGYLTNAMSALAGIFWQKRKARRAEHKLRALEEKQGDAVLD